MIGMNCSTRAITKVQEEWRIEDEDWMEEFRIERRKRGLFGTCKYGVAPSAST